MIQRRKLCSSILSFSLLPISLEWNWFFRIEERETCCSGFNAWNEETSSFNIFLIETVSIHKAIPSISTSDYIQSFFSTSLLFPSFLLQITIEWEERVATTSRHICNRLVTECIIFNRRSVITRERIRLKGCSILVFTSSNRVCGSSGTFSTLVDCQFNWLQFQVFQISPTVLRGKEFMACTNSSISHPIIG